MKCVKVGKNENVHGFTNTTEKLVIELIESNLGGFKRFASAIGARVFPFTNMLEEDLDEMYVIWVGITDDCMIFYKDMWTEERLEKAIS